MKTAVGWLKQDRFKLWGFLLEKSLSSQNAFLKNAFPASSRRGLKINAQSVIGCVQ